MYRKYNFTIYTVILKSLKEPNRAILECNRMIKKGGIMFIAFLEIFYIAKPFIVYVVLLFSLITITS